MGSHSLRSYAILLKLKQQIDKFQNQTAVSKGNTIYVDECLRMDCARPSILFSRVLRLSFIPFFDFFCF